MLGLKLNHVSKRGQWPWVMTDTISTNRLRKRKWYSSQKIVMWQQTYLVATSRKGSGQCHANPLCHLTHSSHAGPLHTTPLSIIKPKLDYASTAWSQQTWARYAYWNLCRIREFACLQGLQPNHQHHMLKIQPEMGFIRIQSKYQGWAWSTSHHRRHTNVEGFPEAGHSVLQKPILSGQTPRGGMLLMILIYYAPTIALCHTSSTFKHHSAYIGLPWTLSGSPL